MGFTDITPDIIGAAIEVHREMGPGLLESVYQRCLEQELLLRGISHEPQRRLPLVYKGTPLDEYFVIDFYFPAGVIVEIKSVSSIAAIHEAQLLNYLKLMKCPIGLILNFNVPVLKDGIKRMRN
jgi:GxxExxY protein